MSREILRILQNFFIHTIFGTNVDDIKVRMQAQSLPGDCEPITDKTPFTEKEVTLMDATEIAFWQTLDASGSRQTNPFIKSKFKKTKKLEAWTALEKIADQNCATLRSEILRYIKKRKSGELESDVGGKSDLVSLMIENSDVFNDEDIVDECIDFMVAGTQTT